MSAQREVIALQVGNQNIHLLVQGENHIRWLKYSAQGEKVSESLAPLVDSVTLERLELVLEPIPGTQAFQEHVIAMGVDSQNQPWWSALSFEVVQPTEPAGLSAEASAGVGIAVTAAVISATAVAVALVYYLRHRTKGAVRE